MTNQPLGHQAGHHHGHHDDGHSSHHDHHEMGGNVNAMARSATLHCLTGCAIGEIAGLMIGTYIGLSTLSTIAISVSLAFLFGYALSTLPLLRAGLAFGPALLIVFAADTLSILSMEIVDNAVMASIPGAMHAGLDNPVFWAAMPVALAVAFFVAVPVNRYLLLRNKGHALTHAYHHGVGEPIGWRKHIPSFSSGMLTAIIIAFLLGGFIVSLAAQAGDKETSDHAWSQPGPERPSSPVEVGFIMDPSA